MRRLVALASTAVLAAGGLAACRSDGSDEPAGKIAASPSQRPTPSQTASAGDSPTADPTPPKVVGTVATGLQAPWGIGFLPDGDAIVTERDTTKVLLLKA